MTRLSAGVALVGLLVSLAVSATISSSAPASSTAAPACSIVGTGRDDVLRGKSARDIICALGGDDVIHGGGGGDLIIAGGGNDRIFGGHGSDEIFGGAGRDRADGGPGDDRILAGLGRDAVFAGDGDDLLYTRDGGADEADGGAGRNLVVADRADAVRRAQRVAELPRPRAAKRDAYVVAAAADIACDPSDPAFHDGRGDARQCRQRHTSDLVLAMRPDAVLIAGDHQYEKGIYGAYLQSFHPSWGRFKQLIRPALGNHEYDDPAGGASGYFRYYGAAAGDPARGYYSFDVGEWHLIALNSECGHVAGGCGRNSPQDQWLQADLRASRSSCTIAYFHRPRFSSGQHGSDAGVDTFWRRLYEARAEIIVTGHDHNYERLAPLDPDGNRNEQGIRQFVVGMGGKNLRGFRTIHPASEARDATTFGVLKLTLRPKGYSWEFVPVGGEGFRDSGTDTCR